MPRLFQVDRFKHGRNSRQSTFRDERLFKPAKPTDGSGVYRRICTKLATHGTAAGHWPLMPRASPSRPRERTIALQALVLLNGPQYVGSRQGTCNRASYPLQLQRFHAVAAYSKPVWAALPMVAA